MTKSCRKGYKNIELDGSIKQIFINNYRSINKNASDSNRSSDNDRIEYAKESLLSKGYGIISSALHSMPHKSGLLLSFSV